MDNEEGLTAEQFVFQRSGEDYSFGFFLPVLDAFKTLRNAPIWEDGPSLNEVVGVAWGIGEIQRLTVLKGAYHNIAMHILGRSLPGVYELRWDKERFLQSEGDVAFHKFEPYPSTLIDTKRLSALLKRRAGYIALSNHLAPLQKRYEGIDGRCHDRVLSSFLYRFLSGVLAVCLGFRSSYRLIVKGDNRAYFIGSQLLIPLSFLSSMVGFGLLLDSFLHVLDGFQEAPQKHCEFRSLVPHDNTVPPQVVP